jgi:hypothetical protein
VLHIRIVYWCVLAIAVERKEHAMTMHHPRARRRIVAFAAIALAPGFASLALAAPARAGSVRVVTPSGDASGGTDGDRIRAAIAAAAPGDTVLLRAGVYTLGKLLPDTIPISGSKGSSTFVAEWAGRPSLLDPTQPANYVSGGTYPSLAHLTTWLAYDAPGGGLAFGRDLSLASFDECIATAKDGITILGEPGTTITSCRGPARWRNLDLFFLFDPNADNGNGLFVLDANGRPILDPTQTGLEENLITYAGGGFLGSLVINSRNATVKGIHFQNMVWPIVAMAPGFTIEGCTITDCGSGVVALLDAKQTLPHAPSALGIVRSAIRRCNITADNPMGIVGSGITVQDCTLTQTVGIFGNTSIGPGDSTNTTSVLDLTHADYNVVTGCDIVNDQNFGGLYINPPSDPGTANFNAVTANSFTGTVYGGVVLRQFGDGEPGFAGFHQTTGNLVANNVFQGCDAPLRVEAYDGGTISGNTLMGNVIQDVTDTNFLSSLVLRGRDFGVGQGRVTQNMIAFNDFRLSGHAGWIYGLTPDGLSLSQIGDILIFQRFAAGSPSGVSDNWIVGNLLPAGTTLCDEVLDAGALLGGEDPNRNHIIGPGPCNH